MYLYNKKSFFADNSRAKPTFFQWKKSFSLKLLSDQFYGQSFIKTVQGPLNMYMPDKQCMH